MYISLKVPLDGDILTGCVNKDRASQKKLYELFYGKMMAVCMRYATDTEEAKDLLNEGFMKVFTNIHKFKPEHSLESWIRRIMINNAIDAYRKNKKHKYNVDIEQAYSVARNETVSSDLGVEEIMKLIQKLSPAYRTVFSLYVIDGFNHREISEKLGISEGTSKSNLSKARMKLQQMIKKLEL